jgi:hypothetical protein
MLDDLEIFRHIVLLDFVESTTEGKTMHRKARRYQGNTNASRRTMPLVLHAFAVHSAAVSYITIHCGSIETIYEGHATPALKRQMQLLS